MSKKRRQKCLNWSLYVMSLLTWYFPSNNWQDVMSVTDMAWVKATISNEINWSLHALFWCELHALFWNLVTRNQAVDSLSCPVMLFALKGHKRETLTPEKRQSILRMTPHSIAICWLLHALSLCLSWHYMARHRTIRWISWPVVLLGLKVHKKRTLISKKRLRVFIYIRKDILFKKKTSSSYWVQDIV